MGWNISIIDSDGGNHLVYENDVLKENKKDIILGNHVWICSCSHIMKGVTIRYLLQYFRRSAWWNHLLDWVETKM